MLKILVITHGGLGKEIIATAESIVGKQEEVFSLTLNPEDSLSTMCQRTGELLKDNLAPEGMLILTDMLGGTPCNASLPFCTSHKIEIISGINLYMLLSAFINRKAMPLEELAKKVMKDGIKNISNAKEMFLQKMK